MGMGYNINEHEPYRYNGNPKCSRHLLEGERRCKSRHFSVHKLVAFVLPFFSHDSEVERGLNKYDRKKYRYF